MRLPLALVLALVAVLARPAAADGTPPTPPGPPTSGPGSPQTLFAAADEEVIPNPVAPGKKVHLFRPTGENVPERLPVVLFAHGFGAPDARPYHAWLERMARQGVLVIYPVYPGLESAKHPTRYDALFGGYEAGLDALEKGKGPKPDRTRAGFIGHSFGGGAVGALAARAAARGIGSKAMWIEAWAPWYDLDKEAWASIPAHAVLLEGAFADDNICDRATAAQQYARATTIPTERKTYVLFRSDAHGEPKLKAGHLAPLTDLRGATVDALDTRGMWRLDDALRAFALTGAKEAGDVAFGRAADPAPLGTWSDGVPVAAPTFGVPDEVEASVKVAWGAGGAREAFGRGLGDAEPFCSLPLPPPEIAPASKLPYSERVERALPAAGWPTAFTEAAKKGPVLVLVAEKSPSETTIEVTQVVPKLKERGVQVLSLSPDDPDARAVAPTSLPSVLLLPKGGGNPRLWREGEEPHLGEALLDLTK